MKIFNRLLFPLLCIFSIGGLLIFSYPSISNFINDCFNKSKYEEFTQKFDTVNNNEINQLLHEAQVYNDALNVSYFENFDNSQYEQVINSYKNILNCENGLIGYIEIPTINVKIPIYHSGDESTLSKGAVHLEGTSFPIGGKDTHSAISAHSGYPAKKFFDDIDTLNDGDLIYIYVLNQRLVYEVYESEVVDPSDTTALKIIESKDLITLITCYPYSVNTHRLLVHAERVDNKNISATDENNYITTSNVIDMKPIIFISIIFILSVIALITIKKKIINKL